MIHVRAMASYRNPPVCGEDSTLQISCVGLPTIKKLEELLNRSLNCAPEFGKDWFELADRIHAFIAAEEAKKV